LAKYRAQKPGSDQVEEKKATPVFFQQAVTDYWAYLKTEYAGLVTSVLERERDLLLRNQNEADQATKAQMEELDTELAALKDKATAYPPTQASEQKPPTSKPNA